MKRWPPKIHGGAIRCDSRATTRSGYTLLELLVSSTAATLLMVGMGSAVVISSRALTPNVGQRDLLSAAESTSVLGDELQSAVHIRELTNDAIEFAVVDRDDDQQPEIIRYAHVSDELQRTMNGVTGVVQSDVKSLQLSPQYRSVSETIGGLLSESTVASQAGIVYGLDLNSWSLDPYNPVGQFLQVDHPPEATLWSVSNARLYLRRSNRYERGEVFTVQLREATGDGLPTSRIIDEVQVEVSTLRRSYGIVTVEFHNADRIPVSTSLCLTIKADEALFGSAVQAGFASVGFSQSGHFISASSGDADWTADTGKGLYFLVSGTHHTLDSTTAEVSRSYFSGVTVETAHVESQQTVRRRIRLLNTPLVASGIWRLDFDRNPAAEIDVDFDGLDDWQYSGNSRSYEPNVVSSLLQLNDGDEFEAVTSNDFAGLITVDVHCRATEIGTGGAFVSFPFGADSANHGQLMIGVEQSDNGGQTVSVNAADGIGELNVARIRQLPDEIVECRLVVDPQTNFVAVWVNDVFHGRTVVTQPLTGTPAPLHFGAAGAAAEFDFLSVQVGGSIE
ncbi:MAG: hypothetical protein Fues2KO_19650 [Fuerstiella sp.]